MVVAPTCAPSPHVCTIAIHTLCTHAATHSQLCSHAHSQPLHAPSLYTLLVPTRSAPPPRALPAPTRSQPRCAPSLDALPTRRAHSPYPSSQPLPLALQASTSCTTRARQPIPRSPAPTRAIHCHVRQDRPYARTPAVCALPSPHTAHAGPTSALAETHPHVRAVPTRSFVYARLQPAFAQMDGCAARHLPDTSSITSRSFSHSPRASVSIIQCIYSHLNTISGILWNFNQCGSTRCHDWYQGRMSAR